MKSASHYLDTNIFFFAYFRPKKGQILSNKVQWMKKKAQEILRKIDNENVKTSLSLIQLSELTNIFKSRMNWAELRIFLLNIVSNPNIQVLELPISLFIKAVDEIPDSNMDANDRSTYLLMKEHQIQTIYSLDKHFRNLPDIECLPLIPTKFLEEK
jgi:predicted nucleic acid-binding protein